MIKNMPRQIKNAGKLFSLFFCGFIWFMVFFSDKEKTLRPNLTDSYKSHTLIKMRQTLHTVLDIFQKTSTKAVFYFQQFCSTMCFVFLFWSLYRASFVERKNQSKWKVVFSFVQRPKRSTVFCSLCSGIGKKTIGR